MTAHYINFIIRKIVRKHLGVLLLFVFLVFFIVYSQFGFFRENNQPHLTSTYTGDKYLIETSNCRIPNEDPFGDGIRSLYKQYSYTPCSSRALLTYVETTNSTTTLFVNQSLLPSYSIFKINCCYSVVTRIVEDNKSDDDIKISDCKYFDKSVIVEDFTIKVDCSNFFRTVYSNIHAVISQKHARKENTSNLEVQPPSVIIFGIDSISRFNLMRTMPKTYNFLETNDFVNLRGYTKIEDNTYPNLMAVLTGKTYEQINDFCHPNKFRLSKCNLIWDKFKALGYTTAYAEDAAELNIFNCYGRQGFDIPPTDFYFRPYFIAAEQLSPFHILPMQFCSGPESSGERIMNIAKNFVLNLETLPKFGLFWTSSFSHDYINFPSSMDDKVVEFLSTIYNNLENTFLIVLSDHGFRFGETRFTHIGWIEERLPYIYIHVPSIFKQVHKIQYENLLINSKRLTNPFDLYMTLQDILRMTDSDYAVESSLACPKCRSLFEEVPEQRSCEDAAIEKHWCLCTDLSYVNTELEVVKEVAQFILNQVNSLVKSFEEGYKCVTYSLKRIRSASTSEVYVNAKNESVQHFMLMIETRPLTVFEATVEVPQEPSRSALRLLGDISRLTRYRDTSSCIQRSSLLQKYCYCGGLLTLVENAICAVINCVRFL